MKGSSHRGQKYPQTLIPRRLNLLGGDRGEEDRLEEGNRDKNGPD